MIAILHLNGEELVVHKEDDGQTFFAYLCYKECSMPKQYV